MEEKQKKAKSFKLTALVFITILGIAAFALVLVYSELEKRDIKETQNRYHAEIKNIGNYLEEGNCTKAALEYARAKETRDKIAKKGFYYSFDSHAKQAHAIEIAECFAHRKEFADALPLLDIEGINDQEDLLRASVIYKNAGDTLKAEEAKSKAETF